MVASTLQYTHIVNMFRFAYFLKHRHSVLRFLLVKSIGKNINRLFTIVYKKILVS